MLADDAAKLFRGASDRHTLQVTRPNEPAICRCDATRITQVLNNLISNAIKYSPSGGEVRVAVSRDPSEITIEVQDEGMGIDPDDVGHIFEPFRRTASTRESIPGVGLGLSVAKRIVEAHGGTMKVSSIRGAGSTFSIRLPCGK